MLSPTRPDRSWPGRTPSGAPSALDQAMLRAYTIERALDYGCSIDDACKLHRRVAAAGGWVETAIALADDDLERARRAEAAGQVRHASTWHLHAAACLRLAQSALEDEPARRASVYRRQRDAFEAGVRRLPSPPRGFDVVFGGAPHQAWHFAPETGDAHPAVVVWGGADGWCEAFHGSVGAYLERGLAVCLLELPGQGWARLAHGSTIDAGFGAMVGAALDALAERGARPDRFGVVGHSMGGTLALAAAAADPRIVACCTNGGSVALDEGLSRFPRVLRRVAAMTGGDDAAALRFAADLAVARRIRDSAAEVLCLQGGRDSLVADEDARRLVELCGPRRATLEYWPEGVHCLYDHAVERNAVIADWLAARLRDPASSESVSRSRVHGRAADRP